MSRALCVAGVVARVAVVLLVLGALTPVARVFALAAWAWWIGRASGAGC